MPKLKPTTPPAYRLHRPSGRAVVTLNGQDHYLGAYGSPESREAYARLIGEWLLTHRPTTSPADTPPGRELTILELIAAYRGHAEMYYRKNGQPTSEQHQIRDACRKLRERYGRTPATEFGPLKLKAVRETMIAADWCRKQVNDQVDRIRRMFKWGVENEMIPPAVYQALQAVAGLRKGRSAARESPPVPPVPEPFIEAVRPHVSRQIWAIIELQLLTAARPGEIVIMRGADLDMSGRIWTYTPERHKTEHHGKQRTIYLGPRAQEIVRGFLKPDLNAYLFSPKDALREQLERKHRNRKTPMSCGNRPGTNRKPHPRRRPKDCYSRDSYRRAIARGCDLADRQARKERVDKGLEVTDERIIPRWHPHQLRHNAATRLRREFGIEAARVVLGHASAAITEVYAEMDKGRAVEVMAKLG